jgi:hypothetical protein
MGQREMDGCCHQESIGGFRLRLHETLVATSIVREFAENVFSERQSYFRALICGSSILYYVHDPPQRSISRQVILDIYNGRSREGNTTRTNFGH